MPRNQKLTKVIAGRTMHGCNGQAGQRFRFVRRSVKHEDQGSRTCNDTGGGGKVKFVHEAKAEVKIDFEDGSNATLCLADPGSFVAVRDRNNAVEYLG